MNRNAQSESEKVGKKSKEEIENKIMGVTSTRMGSEEKFKRDCKE